MRKVLAATTGIVLLVVAACALFFSDARWSYVLASRMGSGLMILALLLLIFDAATSARFRRGFEMLSGSDVFDIHVDRRRFEALLAKATTGELSDQERAELRAMVRRWPKDHGMRTFAGAYPELFRDRALEEQVTAKRDGSN